VPLSDTVNGEPGALLVMETLPLALPVVVGANVAVNVVFEPSLTVTGSVSPEMLKPVPLVLAAVIVTLAVPELVSVKTSDPVPPTSTLPKL